MAERAQITKTQAVRDYLETHPEAMSSEIAVALGEQGITITRGHVSNIKTKLSKAQGAVPRRAKKTRKKAARKTTRKKAVVDMAAPAVVEKPVKSADVVTLEQVKRVATAITYMGGHHRVMEVLEVIRELGGVKKFKDVVDAMQSASYDDIPF